MTSVKENIKNYNKKQIEGAREARKLYHIMGAPSPRNFKAILRQNLIHNCPITPSDVDRADKIYGPDILTLKGKSTRRNHGRAKDDHIEIP